MKYTYDEFIWRVPSESKTLVYSQMKNFASNIPLHWHNFYELEIILDGRGTHILNGYEYSVKCGSAFLLNPTDFHSLKADEPMKLWHVSFDESILSERRICELSSSDMPKIFELDDASLERISSVAKLLSYEYLYPDGCTAELCEALLCILQRSSGIKVENSNEKLLGIRGALIYLDMHFRESPSLRDVASHAGFNPSYFCELFKKITKVNYVTYLNSLKIGYAKTLLSKGFSVSEACYNSGFSSPSNFLKTFKKSVGVAPEEYKQRKFFENAKMY